VQAHEQSFHFLASPHLPAHPSAHDSDYSADSSLRGGTGGGAGVSGVAPDHHQGSVLQSSELDAHYWKNMFLELGFQESGEQSPVGHAPGLPLSDDTRIMPQYRDVLL
jgi:hypothetical protein